MYKDDLITANYRLWLTGCEYSHFFETSSSTQQAFRGGQTKVMVELFSATTRLEFTLRVLRLDVVPDRFLEQGCPTPCVEASAVEPHPRT